jgi:hypothetical protein
MLWAFLFCQPYNPNGHLLRPYWWLMMFNATFNKLVLDMTIMRICQNESLVKADFLTLIIMDIDIIVAI